MKLATIIMTMLLSAPSWAGIYDGVSISTTSKKAVRNLSGSLKVAASADTPTTYTTTLDGTTGLTTSKQVTLNSSSMTISGTLNVLTIMATSYMLNGAPFIGGGGGVSTMTVWNDNTGSMSFGQDAKTAGYYNTFMGYGAGTGQVGGNANTVMGYQAGNQINTGGGNILLGHKAGYYIGDSVNSVFIGYEAAQGAYSGSNNVAVGYRAMYRAKYGENNVAVGPSAGFETEGWNNVMIGAGAGNGAYNATNHANNTLVGHNAGTALTTGDGNILMGFKAGNNLTTGDSNIIIGHNLAAPAVDISSFVSIGGLITGVVGASSVTVQGNLYASAYYGSGANLTGLPAGGVTVATFTATIRQGGDAFTAATGFIPNSGAIWYVDRSTITITGVRCFTVYTSTVNATTFNIAISSDVGNYNGWKYMFNSDISVAANAQTSGAWVAPDNGALVNALPSTLSLHTKSVPSTGTPPADYGCILRYWRRLDE